MRADLAKSAGTRTHCAFSPDRVIPSAMRRVLLPEPSTDHPQHDALLCDGVLWGRLLPGTLGDPQPLTAGEAPRLVARSERAVTDAASAFAAWSDAGWRAFEAAVDRLEEDAGARAVIWPRAGSVLSDAVSTLRFARGRPGVRLLVEPGAWITPAMAGNAPDHLTRFGAALLLCERIEGVVVAACPAAGLGASAVAGLLRPLLERVGTVVGTERDLAGL